MCIGSFLGPQFYSIGLLACLCTNIMPFFTIALYYSLRSWMGIPWYSLLRLVFPSLGFMLIQIKLRIAVSVFMKNWVRISMTIALNLQIVFGKMDIFTIFILMINEHERYFHLLRSSLISLFRLESLVIQIFHLLG